MKKSEKEFLAKLEQIGAEQALIDSSSPLPQWLRPAAAVLGAKPWQVLVFSSFVVSSVLSVLLFPLVLDLFQKGVLAWLLR